MDTRYQYKDGAHNLLDVDKYQDWFEETESLIWRIPNEQTSFKTPVTRQHLIIKESRLQHLEDCVA
ncbi:hypothetical protein CHS0354_034021 [Potamilus streckersoni]|uniref:Uncharacterized protein n=1 Tax=Potamilus streckersoni TaxID=2493646 RepID=A0AAE0RMJ9_9BIVA|nr:hypothetical protein CHS0354_034021 [Potamilus streckersoni]